MIKIISNSFEISYITDKKDYYWVRLLYIFEAKMVKADYGLRNRETHGLFFLNITSRAARINPY